MPARPALPSRPSRPVPRTPGRPGALRRTVAAVTLVTALGVPLAGCDLRLETDPPAPLVPDATESARQHAVADALALAALADVAARTAPEPVAAALTTVATTSRAHVDALGGVYVPTPGASPTPSPTPTPGATPPAAATAEPADVLARLEAAAATARDDAADVPDAALARLLASVATSRTLLGDLLARAAGVERVPHEPFAVPEEVPDGVPASLLTTLVVSEDAAGAAWEVVAARSTDAARTLAAERGAEHRARADAWARLADVAGTGLDPRRAGYDLPDDLVAAADAAEATAAVRALERDLAATYSAAVAAASVDGRAPLVAALVDAARAGWPQGDVVLPGMPDVAVDAG